MTQNAVAAQFHSNANAIRPVSKRHQLGFSLWQAHDLPGGSVDVDLVKAGPCGKAGHCAHGAHERVDEPSSDADPHVPYR